MGDPTEALERMQDAINELARDLEVGTWPLRFTTGLPASPNGEPVLTDLADRLRAVIERRLTVARAALGGGDRWEASSGGNGPTVGPWERDVAFEVWTCEDELDGCPENAGRWRAEGKHIALNDPADAILAGEHALAILRRHQMMAHPDHHSVCGYCETMCHSETGLGCEIPDAPWPCDEIRDLAARYGIEVTE